MGGRFEVILFKLFQKYLKTSVVPLRTLNFLQTIIKLTFKTFYDLLTQ